MRFPFFQKKQIKSSWQRGPLPVPGQPALFLDRDGILNRERGEWTWLEAHLEPLPGAAPLIQAARKQAWPVIVVTNQSGVAREVYGHAEVVHLHRVLGAWFAQRQAPLDAFYYCPHHPSVQPCTCRKPKPGLLLQAAEDFHLDLTRCLLLGDQLRDIQAAQAVGARALLVNPEVDAPPCMERVADLEQALPWLQNRLAEDQPPEL